MTELPIFDILPEVKAHFLHHCTAVLSAEPGAGKTTQVPLAFLDAPWLKGQKIIMLEPRRLAARASAMRMAELLGEKIGQTVGFSVRGETKQSSQTRILIVTEGVFTRQILDDPALEGVGMVILDEFHERHLDSDLSLAFARESQGVLRDDLRLLVMSATLDGARILSLLDDAKHFHSEGRQFPVTTHYLGRKKDVGLEEDVARHIARLSSQLKTDPSETMLVFLPGQSEIHQVARRLEGQGLASHIGLYKLYGSLSFEEQQKLLEPNQRGFPKIILATNIAETSLTLDRVAIVLDSGLVREARFDLKHGRNALQLVRISLASSDQRRGRAGRTQAGTCYRLWDEEQDRAMRAFTTPEILNADLSQLLLTIKLWGAKDTKSLIFLDHPQETAIKAANDELKSLGALDDDGGVTSHGRQLARLALSPRLAHLCVIANQHHQGALGVDLAMILSEQGLGGASKDLGERVSVFRKDHSFRALTIKNIAKRILEQLKATRVDHEKKPLSIGGLLALCYPNRVAKKKETQGLYLMVGGRAAALEPHDPLAKEDFIVIAESSHIGANDRIFLACALDEGELRRIFAHKITVKNILEEQESPKAYCVENFGAIELIRRPLKEIPDDLKRQWQGVQLKQKGLGGLKRNDAFEALHKRLKFAHAQDLDAWPDVSEEILINTIDVWLGPYAMGKAYGCLEPALVLTALKNLLDFDQSKKLDRYFPESLTTPLGRDCVIDYDDEAGPSVSVRVQWLYGLTAHPTIGDKEKIPLIFKLLSPAERPIQITRNIVGFWQGSWAEVRQEMKSRYPRHVWPEDPTKADPTARAKPRGT